MPSNEPRVGALIVFKHSHIGRVLAVKNGRVYTNEGNTSALYGDSNGGTVKNKDYSINDSNIMGYCLMDYDMDEMSDTYETTDKAEISAQEFRSIRIESFQRWLNTWRPKILRQYCGGELEEDGIYGAKTKYAAFVVWKDVLNRLYDCQLRLRDTDFDSTCYEGAGKL